MTPARLAEIRARAEAATPCPWELDEFETIAGRSAAILVPIGGQDAQAGLGKLALLGTQPARDAAFIAHARQDIPDLLAYVAELEADRDALLDGLPEATDEDCARAAGRTVWELPERPGPEVTVLRDSHGDLWERDGQMWQFGKSKRTHGGFFWLLKSFGPLTDATPALPVTEPEEGRTDDH